MAVQSPLKIVPTSGLTGELREWAAGDVLSLAMGGTGASDQAGARTALGLGPAAIAAILGIVSMSGATPNGAIMETGTTSGGTYYRFASGLQICINTIVQSGGSTAAKGAIFGGVATAGGAFPIPFINVPVVIPGGTDSAGGGWAVMDIYPTQSSWGSFSTRNYFSAGTSGTIYLFAIGRWA